MKDVKNMTEVEMASELNRLHGMRIAYGVITDLIHGGLENLLERKPNVEDIDDWCQNRLKDLRKEYDDFSDAITNLYK